jgi:excisionase family DNA binding protein
MVIELQTVKIVSSPEVLGGKPRIEGKRISVQLIAESYAHFGQSIEYIAEAYDLAPAEIHAALSYYYAHVDEIEQSIRREDQDTENVPHIEDAIKELRVDMLTVAEVAASYRINDRTVREAIHKGWLKARKSGGTWLIRRQDAHERWGENNKSP